MALVVSFMTEPSTRPDAAARIVRPMVRRDHRRPRMVGPSPLRRGEQLLGVRAQRVGQRCT
jgi:hypothetical protein